ncbi:winged helix-turn-helix domain-containing protein [Roseomonas vastitatis]|uniref:Winged helix-turn-helix domain-containing protein n=1 Tax=Teichococcus vastitatis TaxID=2307076 RepID=A0ABS9W6R1_9PROT|nr:winged helix-turn-helix domain-containing protein [Pseudoroseomonas vastitatis]
MLLHLAMHGGQVVERGDLIEAVWSGIFITENGLSQCVAEIRRALGADEMLLRTLPRRGYLLDIPPPSMTPVPAAPAYSGGIPVLAMLPLRLVPPDPGLAVFADILLDGIVGALAMLRQPVVISANSTRHVASLQEDVPSLARRLGAHYIVTGSVCRLSGHVRLWVELAEAAQGVVLWHRAYVLTEAGLLEALDELATAIAHTALPHLRDAEIRATRRRQHDIGAYHLMLEAQCVMTRLDRGSFDTAGEMLWRAAALDPGFAAPHTALAVWHSLRIGQGWSADPAADGRALEAAVQQALELDAGHARALALLGHSRTILHRDYATAQDLLDRALEIAPNDAETCLWVSPTLAYTGRTADAVRSAERAIRLSPEDPLLFRYQHFLSIAHYAQGDWEEAAQWGLRSIRSNRGYTSNLIMTAAALAALGRAEEARPIVAHFLELVPSYRVSVRVPRQAFRDGVQREQYGRHLLAAGLPE